MQKEKRRFEELDGRIQIAKQHRAGQAECKGFKGEPVNSQGLNSAKWCLASIYSFQHVEETMWLYVAPFWICRRRKRLAWRLECCDKDLNLWKWVWCSLGWKARQTLIQAAQSGRLLTALQEATAAKATVSSQHRVCHSYNVSSQLLVKVPCLFRTTSLLYTKAQHMNVDSFLRLTNWSSSMGLLTILGPGVASCD